MKKTILSFIICLAVFNSFGQIKSSKNRPNILFCISDDQSYKHISLENVKELNTPNIDRIANDGILFQNAYCNVASCAPSRANILTVKNI